MGLRSAVRVGAYQFAGSGDCNRNGVAILRGIKEASRQGVKLLVLHECALSGYAGLEISSPKEINREALSLWEHRIAGEAALRKLAVVMGTTTFQRGKVYNSLQLINARGRTAGRYHKRAMYGTDGAHYTPGERAGLHRVAGLRVGLRICFEFRFPEYFRELLLAKVDLAVMGFSMVGADDAKRATARAHLMSRAAENGFFILAANNLNGVQNAPTCLIDPDGRVVAEAPADEECLIAGTVDPAGGSPLSRDIAAMARGLAERGVVDGGA